MVSVDEPTLVGQRAENAGGEGVHPGRAPVAASPVGRDGQAAAGELGPADHRRRDSGGAGPGEQRRYRLPLARYRVGSPLDVVEDAVTARYPYVEGDHAVRARRGTGARTDQAGRR